MIVVDTNQFDLLNVPSGALFAILRQVALQHGHTVAIPEMVIVETLAHYRHRIEEHFIDDDEGRRLVRIIRRGSGSVVTWRRAQMVLLSAQCMDAPAIAKVAFTSEDRVRVVIRSFNADGFSSLYPKYKGSLRGCGTAVRSAGDRPIRSSSTSAASTAACRRPSHARSAVAIH